jgi:hypothetical protein
MKEKKKSRLIKTPKPPEVLNLRGKRVRKWTVLEYAGKEVRRLSGRTCERHWWLCLCNHGHEKTIEHTLLTGRKPDPCPQCRKELHGSQGKLLTLWRYLLSQRQLSETWLDFETFCREIGELPTGKASIRRYDASQPHGPDNTYWVLYQKGSFPPNRLEQLHELRIAKNKLLQKVRAAKTKADRFCSMRAAYQAGWTYEIISYAAGVSRQYVHQLIGEKRKTQS